MISRFSSRSILVLISFMVAVAAAGWVVKGDPDPGYTWEPILGPSAVDSWTAPWTLEEAPGVEDATGETDGDLAPSCAVRPQKWLVVGWDGADWGHALELVEEGRLPNLEGLMRRGSYGSMASFQPTLSPTLWTTVATGVKPDRHGIFGFYDQKPRWERIFERLKHFGQLKRELFSNADRRAKAVWNELSDRGRSVYVFGYHNTFPVEEVEGVMVSNYLVQDLVGTMMSMEGATDGALARNLVYPPERLGEVLEIQDRVNHEAIEALPRLANLSDREIRGFYEAARRELGDEADRRPYFLTRAYTFDAIIAETAFHFLAEGQADATFVHFQSIDWASHYFLYFDDPEAYGEYDWTDEERAALEKERPRYEETVRRFYENADGWLGELLSRVDLETTGILLLSDHGFQPEDDPSRTGYHDDAPPGILVAAGPGIARGRLVEGATLYDVLPTLMKGMGLPVAEDLDGRVLGSVFCDEALGSAPGQIVASYQTEPVYVPTIAAPPEIEAEVLQQLEALGYVK